MNIVYSGRRNGPFGKDLIKSLVELIINQMNKITINENHKIDILNIDYGHIRMATRNVPNASPLAYAAMAKWPLLSINIEGNKMYVGGKAFVLSKDLLIKLKQFNETSEMHPLSLIIEYGD